MKKYSYFIIFAFGLFTSTNANAQQMPTKYAMLELFTNTPCVICGSQNPSFFKRLENFEGQYHLISFYPGAPYLNCIFYQANITENKARLAFYPQVNGSPTVIVNGEGSSNPNGITTAVLNDLTGGESWLQLAISEEGTVIRDVEIAMQTFAENEMSIGQLFAVIVEREIMYNAPNGETVHHNVFRKFLTPVEGDNVDLSSGNETVSYQYDIDNSWNANEVFVIAWISNPETNEIINSGTRFDNLVLSQKNLVFDNKINVFPVPATSFINISSEELIQNARINMYDILGRKIFSSKTDLINSEYQINTNSWNPGNYTLEILQGNKLHSQIVQIVR